MFFFSAAWKLLISEISPLGLSVSQNLTESIQGRAVNAECVQNGKMSVRLKITIKEPGPPAQTASCQCQRGDISAFHYIL